ncbi:hypothetical protein SAMN05216420_105179 [Nitrosospira sp. Nl5]|nr:hypothetical protein SAMN05216420_105179 [Nitrosospira sp. Nl5]
MIRNPASAAHFSLIFRISAVIRKTFAGHLTFTLLLRSLWADCIPDGWRI